MEQGAPVHFGLYEFAKANGCGLSHPSACRIKCEEELEREITADIFVSYVSFNKCLMPVPEGLCKTGEVVYQRTLPPSIVPGLYEFAKANGWD